ncbi:MAG: hypothetical protein AAF717_18730 [Bacteroidota bacterium]
MKSITTFSLITLLLLFGGYLNAQVGVGNRFGRQRTAIPQAPTPPPEPENLTAEEVVEKEMPEIKKLMELDPFEEAVVRSVLEKYVQKRMELQILQLEPNKMKEEYLKIQEMQDAELKASLPEEKFQTYLELRENRSKVKRKQKKKKKNKT